MFEASTQIRVRYADCDPMQIVYHGHYTHYFEIGRAEAFRELGLPYAEMEVRGMSLAAVDLQIRYHRAVRYDELLTIKTIVEEIPLRTFKVRHQILNEVGLLTTTAQVQFIIVKKGTLQKCSAPDYFRAIFEPYFQV
jgi:acyl-CoA thioester hydrolase